MMTLIQIFPLVLFICSALYTGFIVRNSPSLFGEEITWKTNTARAVLSVVLFGLAALRIGAFFDIVMNDYGISWRFWSAAMLESVGLLIASVVVHVKAEFEEADPK